MTLATRWRSPLLERPGAVGATGPDAGVAWHYGDPVAEQRALETGAAFVDLSHLGVVTVAGPDRLTLAALADHPAPGRAATTHALPRRWCSARTGTSSTPPPWWTTVSGRGWITEGAAAPALTAWLDAMRFMLRVEVADVTGAWAVLGDAVGREADDGLTRWRDPWPAVLPGGTRYGPPPEEHPGVGWSCGLGACAAR